MDRWQSVKDAPVFRKNERKGFAQNKFKREQFKRIAMRIPADIVHSVYTQIKEMMTRISNRGEISYDR